ncbi:MAG: VacJ family lipoprotein [Thermodesulfobacteriota bacterium]
MNRFLLPLITLGLLICASSPSLAGESLFIPTKICDGSPVYADRAMILAKAEAMGSVEVIDEFGDDFDEFDDDFEDEVKTIADPIEPFNRAMFHFNDKLYFWLLKPAARGYGFIVPEKGRVGVRRFFSNITTPIRFVNALLQFKFKPAGAELSRFLINTTVGVAGFMDPARDRWKIYKQREDFGQTLGFYGAGPGFFITWPFIGPSSVRGTIGYVGDLFLDPTTYLFPNEELAAVGIEAYEKVNSTSLDIGVYEDMKRDAIDPYTFIRDAYYQHREKLVKE